MGSISKKFVCGSLTFAMFLSLGYLALPLSQAAQGTPEAVIMGQREAAKAQEQVKLQRRLTGEFAILQVQANAQHVMIEQWQKAHSSESSSWAFTEARGDIHKKRFH